LVVSADGVRTSVETGTQPFATPRRRLMSLTRLLRWRTKGATVTDRDIKRGLLDVEIDHRSAGFFAQLNWCLYIFAYAQKRGIRARVRLVSENYQVDPSNPDWFVSFFEYTEPARPSVSARRKKIAHFSELGFQITPDMSFTEANKAFFGTVSLHPGVRAAVDDFKRQHFVGQVLGVHFRGTDKHREAEPVSYETALEAIVRNLDGPDRYETLFLSSDEAGFLTYVQGRLPGRRVIWRDDSARSESGRSVHRAPGAHTSTIGYDALENALLLSECSKIVRTTSFLSAWSKIFNPTVRIELLNKPREDRLWYPEREIIRTLVADVS
jgi:hypothetical protein